MIDPFHRQTVHVGGVDLLERAMALGAVRTRIAEPVVRVSFHQVEITLRETGASCPEERGKEKLFHSAWQWGDVINHKSRSQISLTGDRHLQELVWRKCAPGKARLANGAFEVEHLIDSHAD